MHENKHYKHPILTKVIARIDFISPITALEKKIPDKIVKAVSKIFPISEPQETIGLQFQIGGENPSNASETHATNWKFFSKSRDKSLTVNAASVFVEYKTYSTFEEFLLQFSVVIDAFENVFPDIMGKRFGLRYISNVDLPSMQVQNASKIISKDLLSGIFSFPLPGKATRLMNIIEMKFEEQDISVRFQYGIPNVDYPSIIKNPKFILDIDAYVQASHTMSEAKQYMVTTHDHIQDLFESSITEELRKQMDG